jgi:hypothetical protein
VLVGNDAAIGRPSERPHPAGVARPASKPGAKSAALRRAALKLLRTPEYAHPFYGGAFVLVGDDGAIGKKNRTLNAECRS